MPLNSGRVGFGPFELDLATGEVRKSGRLLKLRPQPASVLGLLAGRAGSLVSREEIRQLLWGESTFVDYESGVDYCINRVRAVLCDRTRAPRYIETLPRRGYRFIAPVRRLRPFAEPTLAVLPFANLNGDPAREFFADGVTDALITELARIPAVRVLSRQSVLHLKGSVRKADEIARDLGVDGIVEGSVLQEGGRARVTAQLILLDPERHVWARSYDCDLSSILPEQRDAAREIAACIAESLRPEREPAPRAAPAPPEIVEAYLHARAELRKMSAPGIAKALQLLREITLKAPGFAPGLAEHALCLGSLGYWGHIPIRETYPGARQMALLALAIDDALDPAHLALGMAYWLLDWDMASADREFLRAVELSPSNSDARTLYAIYLSHVGRPDEAKATVEYALRLDHGSLLANTAAAWIYLSTREFRKAETQARRTLDAAPDSLHALYVLGWAAWAGRRPGEAVDALEKALGLSREALSLAFLGHIYGLLGRSEEAHRLLHELDRLLSAGHAPPIAFVILHAGLGDADAAFDWLEKALRIRDDKLYWLTTGFPAIDPLRADPRLARFLPRLWPAPVSAPPAERSSPRA